MMTRAAAEAPTGVLLMTFGSAVTADDVPAYLASVRHGSEPSAEVLAEFRRRYTLIGRSPLIDITRAQAAALQALLNTEEGAGTYLVEVGMLHSSPWIEDAVKSLTDRGMTRVLGIVLAPQYSPIIMGGYVRRLEAAAARAPRPLTAGVAGPWHLTPGFVDCLAWLTTEALARLDQDGVQAPPIIFTAHSLPRSVVDREPGYIDQLRETAAAVAARAGLSTERWTFAYQSAGHTPEEWLKPDFRDLLPGLAAAGHADVLVVPIQFLADHLEILFDIDIAGRQEAEAAGMGFHRIEMPNTAPGLIRALADVVRR